MKRITILLLLVVTIGFVNSTSAQNKKTKTVCFKSNMHCENCEAKLTEYLKFEKGVKDLKVDVVSNTIKINYRAGKNNEEKLIKAIEKNGYTAEKISQVIYEKIVAGTKEESKVKGDR